MDIPLRKKLRPYTKEEIDYISAHYKPEFANRMINDDEEYDIPAVDKLEKEIEETFKEIEGGPLDVYKEFIKLTDKFNELLRKYSPCKKGCGKCCSIAVQISQLEKNIIKEHLEKTNEIKKYNYFKYPNEPKFVDGIQGGNYTGKNCPFLENDECKIYPVRPYKCRRYISLDDDCVLKYEKLYSTGISIPLSSFGSIYSDIYYERIIRYYNQNKNINKNILNDIRDYFNKI